MADVKPEASNNASVPFALYPAIDVLDGACVRLLRGDYNAKTEYSQHPRSVAERWLTAGAQWLHVVDLNGAKSGLTDNFAAIQEVVEAALAVGARVQVGGGVRTYETLERWLNVGVTRCVVGTAALEPGWAAGAVNRFGSEAVVVGLDGRGGKIAVRGWLEQTDVTMVETAAQLAADGVAWALVTDVDKDGTLSGANLALATAVQDASGIRTIASGGVRDLTDVLAAREAGLAGAIAGKSLFDGTLDIRAALAALGTMA